MQQTDIIPPPGQNDLLFILMDVFIICIVIGAIIFWLHNYKKPHQGLDVSEMRLNPTTITVVMLILAILGPMAFNIYPRTGNWPLIYLIGMSWQIIGLSLADIIFSAIFFLVGLPFMFFRLVFVYQMYKYYRGLTTKKRTILVGILGEIQFPLIGLIIMPFALVNPFLAVIFSLPIPFLLVAGLVILRYVQVPQPIDGWKELDKSQDWWDQEKQLESER